VKESLLKPSSIIVVDDHPVVAHSVGMVLSDEGFEVQAASSAQDLRGCLRDRASTAALVILDVGLPDADGIKLVSEIQVNHGLPVLIFSALSDEKIIRACDRNGAAGFVSKSSNPRTLISAIGKILSGERFFPQSYLDWIKTAVEDVAVLSDRQERVLRHLIAGYRNKDIADMLHFAEGSVKNIVTELLQIFRVDSRQRLILAALDHGYKPQSADLAGSGALN